MAHTACTIIYLTLLVEYLGKVNCSKLSVIIGTIEVLSLSTSGLKAKDERRIMAKYAIKRDSQNKVFRVQGDFTLPSPSASCLFIGYNTGLHFLVYGRCAVFNLNFNNYCIDNIHSIRIVSFYLLVISVTYQH